MTPEERLEPNLLPTKRPRLQSKLEVEVGVLSPLIRLFRLEAPERW
jgi:hypothetical protein